MKVFRGHNVIKIYSFLTTALNDVANFNFWWKARGTLGI
jgi:hypothetical protein